MYLDDAYRERAQETPGRSGGVLENALLESLGQGVYERAHEEQLVANARFHETLVDLDLSLGTRSGVVVALRADGAYRLRNVVDQARDVIPHAHVPYED